MNQVRMGATYVAELFSKRTGEVLRREVAQNLVPIEGLNAMANILFAGAAAPTNLYIGLYGADYTPLPTVTAATLPGLAGEITGYEQASRVLFVPDAVVAGAVLNTTNKAEFSFAAPDQVYGAFMTTNSTKGGTTGTLFSAVKFPTVKNVDGDLALRVHAGFQFLSI